MKIRAVKVNNHKKAFAVKTYKRVYDFPFARLAVKPSKGDPIARVYVDEEIGKEAFTYVLRSGREGTIHIDHVLEYNQDPSYMRDLLLYQLTVEAGERVKQSGISKRELIRRMGTSRASSTGSWIRTTTARASTRSSRCCICWTARSRSG